MKLKEIIAALERFAPPSLQENYDNAGLLTGHPEMEANQALLCLDSTEEVIEEAIKTGCNVVIAHHPIIFSGLKKITGKTYVERAIIKAIRHDIAIYAAHTNLDSIRHGVSAKIGDRLGLKDMRVLAPVKNKLKKLYTFAPLDHAEKVRAALFEAGAGVIGNYDQCSFNAEGHGTFRAGDTADPFVGKKGTQHQEKETKIEVIFPAWLESGIIEALKKNHPYEEVAFDVVALDNTWENAGFGMTGKLETPMNLMDFLSFLKKKMNTGLIRYTNPMKRGSQETDIVPDPVISTVAVCGGAGSFLLKDAMAAGADCFVTGDFKYHQFFDAEDKIVIADIGHFESEQFTMELFDEVLRENFPTFAVRFTSINTNPVKYY